MDVKYLKNKKVPVRLSSTTVVLNNNLIIGASKNRIYEYNIDTEIWKHSMTIKLSTKLKFESWLSNICFDKKNKYLYIRDDINLVIIHYPSKKVVNTYNIDDLSGIYDECTMIIDSKYHIIGGYVARNHLIWNNKTSQLDVVHTFNDWIAGMEAFGLVYVKTQQIAIVFGGYDCGNSQQIDGIWIYSLNSNKWSKSTLTLPLKMSDFGYILTNDERYIFIFSDIGIHIFDLIEMSIVKSRFDINMIVLNNNQVERYCAICYGKINPLIVYGYIRECYEKPTMKNVNCLPHEIVKMINKWHMSEDIHLFGLSTKNHHVIPIEDLFND